MIWGGLGTMTGPITPTIAVLKESERKNSSFFNLDLTLSAALKFALTN
jgi:hypothetical protein